MERNKILIWLICIIMVPILAFLGLFLNTYYHEYGHKDSASRFNIDFKIDLTEFLQGKWVGGGRSVPRTYEGCTIYNNLDLVSKSQILLAGIINSLKLLVLLTLVILLLFIPKTRINNNYLYLLILLLLISIIVVILFIIINISANLDPNIIQSDMWKLVNDYRLNCEMLFSKLQ